ncbi:hypothetical protein Esi_0220_0053 [Ectocarpus siliculosus]|uniref:Uncharacterized protein n=1 Tax=Ectocarpus siliculosus TaxID=2880 RepID=D8LIP3_ECTSI|nr:hypothetical protein Esi_0220_0053 [Ectocarpus siliculosus]|eukprot:CBN75953.1 hypothetical protein Esi_0220_0053 [Ectocarpus siliculosus]
MGQEAKITGALSLLVLLVLLVCYSRVDLFATASSGHLRTSDDPRVSSTEAYGRGDGDSGWQRAAEEKEGLAAARAPPAVLGRSLDSFPSASDATIMFLHVFKCAGTSLREVFMALAEEKGWSHAVVEECTRRRSPRRLGAGPALTVRQLLGVL